MVSGCTVDCYNNIQKLLQDLTNPSIYSPAINPNNDVATPLYVFVYFALIKTIALNNDGRLSIAAVLGLKWNDPRLKWTKSSYNNLSQVEIPANSIWTPTLLLFNGVGENLLVVVSGETSASVSYTGDVTASISRQFDATCQMDLTFFPFDTQNCSLMVQNYDLRISTLGSYFIPILNKAVTDAYTQDGALTLVDTDVRSKFYCFTTITACFSNFNVSIMYKRNPSYYLSSVAIPSTILTVICGIVYLVPSENGAKASMACAIMVAFYFLQQVVMRLLPSTVNTPFFALAIMCELGLGCYTLLCAVATMLTRSIQPAITPCCAKFLQNFECLIHRKTNSQPKSAAVTVQVTRENDNAVLKMNQTKVIDLTANNEADLMQLSSEYENPLVVLLSELVQVSRENAQFNKQLDTQKIQQADVAHQWRLMDLIINSSLLTVYFIAAIVVLILFQYRMS